jgi:hypothetical protein
MTEQDKAKLKRLASRGGKIEANPRVDALFNLADRVAFQAMRVGAFDQETARLIGAFEPWGLFIRDLKRAVDGAKSGKKIACPKAPEIPAAIDTDLRPAVVHFAGLAGVSVPEFTN